MTSGSAAACRDEAYFEYGGETALHLLGSNDVIVVRTFSKAFGLASARVGYALADLEIAAELNARQQPAPVSTISAALALAGLEAGPPDVSETIAERERLTSELRAIGFEPLPTYTNFVLVPHERAQELYEALLGEAVVRPSPGLLDHGASTRRRRPAARRPRGAPLRVGCISSGGGVSPWRPATRELPDVTQPCVCLRAGEEFGFCEFGC